MKTLQLTLLLACSTLIMFTKASAQVIFNDNMESYPTANSTSTNDIANNVTSNPQFWSRNAYQGGGTQISVSAGISGITGSRAAILSADFTGATGFWGAQIYSRALPGSGVASSFADMTYGFTIQTNTGQGFWLEFISFDATFAVTGTYRKQFVPSAAANYQTFSGNLGETGWAANPNGFNSNPLVLNAANYSWSIEYSGEFGWTGAGNSLQVDQATLSVVPEPGSIALLLLGASVLLIVRRRRIA